MNFLYLKKFPSNNRDSNFLITMILVFLFSNNISQCSSNSNGEKKFPFKTYNYPFLIWEYDNEYHNIHISFTYRAVNFKTYAIIIVWDYNKNNLLSMQPCINEYE